jgi:radical SAM protein (TIGR01212 family)
MSSEPTFLWGDNRRFNSYSRYFKGLFGERVQKLTIDAGFTCPNRDGKVAHGGCTFCLNDAFNPSYCTPEKSIRQQLEEGIEFHVKRYQKATKYLAYFQAYSNTYAPLERLKEIYSQAFEVPEVIGVVIGTRPDCVDEEKLDYFAELSKDKYVTIEYGIESCYNKTLEKVNRGHTYEQAIWAIEETAKRHIKVGAHMIFGFPGETRQEMLAQAEILSKLPLDTIKFHQLQIFKATQMAKEYALFPERFSFFELEEYIDFFVHFLERLNPKFVVERFAGEVPPRFQAGPGWGMVRNEQLVSILDKRLNELNTWQGRLYHP